MTEIQNRELHIRAAVNAETREISGVGVPYGETITIWGQRERLTAGSVEAEGAKLFYRHSEPIGVVTSATDDKSGWHPTAKISETPRGDEAYTLARDGVLDGLSIGFEPVEWHVERDDDGVDVIVYDRVLVREVSLVPFPAYPSARVESVRERPAEPRRKETPMPDTETQERGDDLRELRESVEDLGRRLDVGLQAARADETPAIDQRSAGTWLRDLARNDAESVREYEDLVERAYTGGTSADGLLTPQYVGDTIRLIEAPNVLGSIFSTGQLPAKGLKLEFGVLDVDTVAVDKQAAEGDDLATGKISVDVDYADIETFGGVVELSRQQIERTTNVNMLDLHMRALSLRAGARKAAVLRAHYDGVVAANKLDPDRVAVVADETDYIEWVSAIIDAAEWYANIGLSLDALVADKTKFKTLASLVDLSGRPLMIVSGEGVNTVGRINPKALSGDLAGVEVKLNLKQAAPGAAFVNSEAIRQYNSPVVELADENIVNLSKQFGVYYYAANATEIPGAIVPVVAALPAGVPDGE
jgi:HK97 family phage prohead protease